MTEHSHSGRPIHEQIFHVYLGLYYTSPSPLIYRLSSTLLAPSEILLTSPCPFLTTSSMRFFAFCKSSGSTSLFNSYFLSFLLCSCLVVCIHLSALSEALTAESTAARRDSPVGGGMGTWMVRGLLDSGERGVRECGEAAMAVVMGFMC